MVFPVVVAHRHTDKEYASSSRFLGRRLAASIWGRTPRFDLRIRFPVFLVLGKLADFAESLSYSDNESVSAPSIQRDVDWFRCCCIGRAKIAQCKRNDGSRLVGEPYLPKDSPIDNPSASIPCFASCRGELNNSRLKGLSQSDTIALAPQNV